MPTHAKTERYSAQSEYPNPWHDDEVLQWQVDNLWRDRQGTYWCPGFLVLMAVTSKDQKIRFRPKSRSDVIAFLRRFERGHYDLYSGRLPRVLHRDVSKLRWKWGKIDWERVPYSYDMAFPYIGCTRADWRRHESRGPLGMYLPGDIAPIGSLFEERARSARHSPMPEPTIDWREVVAKYSKAGVRKFMGRCDKGKRSDVIYRIISSLAEQGARAEEAYAVAAESGAAKAKAEEYGGRMTWLWRDVDRIFAKRALQ